MGTRWVARIADGVFTFGGYFDPSPWNKSEFPQQPPGTYDPDLEIVVPLGDRHPIPRTERYDGAGGIRPATAQEIAAWDAAERDRRFAAEMDADHLRLLKAIALWAGEKFSLTPAQVRAEVLAKYRSLT